MDSLPPRLQDGHLFVELRGDLWLIDTGAPMSFGASPALAIAGEDFSVGADYAGLTAETLSQFVGVACAGLIGADILGRFDHIFDTTNSRLTVSLFELSHSGESIPLNEFMGIPIVTARVGGRAPDVL